MGRGRGRGQQGEGSGARGRAGQGRAVSHWVGLGWAGPRVKIPWHAQPQIGIQMRNKIRNETKQHTRLNTTSDKEICLGMMQHPCQLRFLFTHDTDNSHCIALNLGRRSETGKEKGGTPEFGE
jgi:hypothetical protein